MEGCLFCRIARHEIPATIVYENEDLVAFRDINPAAPVHILVIPKRHVSGVLELSGEDEALMAKVFSVIKKLAEENGVSERGFRVVVNSGPDAGQSVAHLHFHLLGGKAMGWPPG